MKFARCTVTGKLINTVKGVSKNGKNYVFSVILVGDSPLNVFNADCSDFNQFDDVSLDCYVSVSEQGELSFRKVKEAE